MVGRNLLERTRGTDLEFLAPGSAELDLRDAAAVRDYVREACPDAIVHAAGKVGGIAANIADPTGFLIDNAEMGFNLVRAAHEAGIARLLNLASSCMYPRDHATPLREELILTGPLEPTNEGYALAKIAVTRLCAYVRGQFPGRAYKTVIPCNLYGRWDNFDPR